MDKWVKCKGNMQTALYAIKCHMAEGETYTAHTYDKHHMRRPKGEETK